MSLLPSQLEIKTAYQNAPVYLQDFIGSDEMYTVFQDMIKVHKLHIDQGGNLAVALNSIILGLRPLGQFPELLKEALNSSDDALNRAIANEANSKVFSALRALTKTETTPTKATPVLETAPAAVAFAPASSPIQSVQKAPLVTQLESMPVAAAVVPPTPMVVAENKMAMTSAPAPVTTAVPMPPSAPTTAITPPIPKEPKPEAPVKYHGTDPYREPFE
jgi:hypothetical protein